MEIFLNPYKLLSVVIIMNLKEAIVSRKSVRDFMPNKVPDWRKIMRAIDYARFAPSAGNNFVTKFLIITNEKKIAMLAKASQQDFVGDVKAVVLVASDIEKLVDNFDDRGKKYTLLQAGAAIQNFWLGLVEQKLDSVWVGHFYEEQIKRELKIPDNFEVNALFPIGKMKKITVKRHLKMDLDQIVYFEKWGSKKMNPPARKVD